MNPMNSSTDAEHLLSVMRADARVAITAPFIRDSEVLVGYALSPEEGCCACLPLNEFIAICSYLYQDHMVPVAYHGLKRIWEFLDDRSLRPARDEDKKLDINKIEDTKLMAYLLDPDLGREVEFGEHRVQAGLTLSHLAAQYLGKDCPSRNSDIHADISPELLAPALAHDACIIHSLATELRERMNKDLHNLYRNLELPLMQLLDDMRRVGIGVDSAACAQERDRIEREMARLEQKIRDGAELDLRSERDVYRFLVARGVQFMDPSVHQWRKVSNFILEQTAPHYPWVQSILDYRKMSQDLSFLRHAAARDRLHPVWGQTRSATSRIYARNPAVQNVSRDLRHFFVEAPDHVLIKADYSQAQMRILAHLCREEALKELFKDPSRDVHTETSELLGLKDRNVAKEINFGICYGMTPWALCRKINELKEKRGEKDFIDTKTAWDYMSGFHDRYPRIRFILDLEWNRLKSRPVDKRGVSSLTGRFRKFNRRATSRVERQFRVTWPQQIEADLIKTSMVRLDKIFKEREMEARLVMMIHDSIWVEAPLVKVAEVRELMRAIMTTAGKLDVPLEVDID